MKYVILDPQGRRMVLPRETESDAILVIARAVAGKNASAGECWVTWERLRAQGYSVTRVTEEEPGRRRA